MTDRLLLEEVDGGRVQIGHQRAGTDFPEAQGPPFAFTPPLDAAALEDLRWYLEDYLVTPYAVYEDRGRRIEGQIDAWGEALFAAAFGGNGAGRLAYERAMEARDGAELAIAGRSAAFLGLPWELLKDPERADPLALRFGAMDRLAPAPAAPMGIAPSGTLRVLVVVARPGGLNDVGFRMVARPLLERLEAVRGEVMLEVLRPPSFEALVRRLGEAAGADEHFHILHFDGHGTFGTGPVAGFGSTRFDTEPQGYLAFERPEGGAELVTAGDFARVVAQAKVPVVVLNACRSGTLGGGAETAMVEAAVATRLLHAGAASVVAMGYSVYAVAAAEFMAAFYEALFAGNSTSAAVAAGLARLKAQPERPSPKGMLQLRDWIVPVHYGRRAITFPQLKRARAKGAPPLDAMLDALRSDGTAVALMRNPLAPDRRFIGRDRSFYALELALRTERVVLLQGTAGTGKTELAKAFGRWWRDTGGAERPEWVLFHSFAPGTASFGLDAVATDVGTAVWGSKFVLEAKSAAERAALVLQLLRENRLLLVWDNFESVRSMPDATAGAAPLPRTESDRLRGFLRELRAPGGRSGLILTSRSPERWLGDDLRRIEVGGLETAEAAEMAEDALAALPVARERRGERSFADLLDWLEGHSLSLRVLLPKLETTAPADLLASLKGATAALPPGFEGEERTAHLGASLNLSLDQLDPAMRARIRALALFEGVADEDVLAAFSAAPGVPPLFAGVTKAEWGAALDRLSAMGIMTPLELGMAGLHPALPAWLAAEWRAAAGSAFAAERAAAEHALRQAYVDFGKWLREQIGGGDAETAFALLDRQRRTLGRLLQGALAAREWEEALLMLSPLSMWLDARGSGPEASRWAQRAKQAVEAAAGDAPDLDSPASALWLFAESTEANRALRAGDHARAERSYDAVRRRLEAGSDPARGWRLQITYHQLGMVAQLRGELTAAEAWYRRALEVAEAPNDWSMMVASTYQELGFVAQLRGELPEAEAWYRRALEVAEAFGDRPAMAPSYCAIGLLAEARQDPMAALDGMVRCVSLFAEFPHPSTNPGPRHLARLTGQLGWLALEGAWQRAVGASLPPHIRAGVRAMLDHPDAP